MGRRAAVILAVLLAGSSIAAAQVRLVNKGVQQLPADNQGLRRPPTRTVITVRPRPTDTPRRHFIFLCCLTGAFFGYAPFPYEPLLMQAGPPLENAPLGGLQLDIEPRGAEVYVDGTYTGLVSDFSGYFEPLKISAGPHHVTVLAPAYEPLTIPVMVVPGRTITWRGTLTRAYGR